MTFPQELMTKQFIGKVRGAWCDFYVFCTGNPKFLLFCPLDSDGCFSTLQIPVAKSKLRRDWKSKMIV